MADIEEAAGDKGQAREWLARAIGHRAIPCGYPMAWRGRAGFPFRPFPAEIVPASGKHLLKCWRRAENRKHSRAHARSCNTTPTRHPAPVVESTPVKIAKPAMAELPRPPDDPGLDDDLGVRNRTLATDG
jgi:uncharacterized membrane-anchored protein